MSRVCSLLEGSTFSFLSGLSSFLTCYLICVDTGGVSTGTYDQGSPHPIGSSFSLPPSFFSFPPAHRLIFFIFFYISLVSRSNLGRYPLVSRQSWSFLLHFSRTHQRDLAGSSLSSSSFLRLSLKLTRFLVHSSRTPLSSNTS